MEKLNIGLVGTYQLNFDGDKQGEINRAIKELAKLADEKEFNFFPITEGVVTNEDAEKACRELNSNNVDFALILNASFSAGEIIPILSRVKGRIGLWAVPEPNKSGNLLLNSFCGMNMYGSIIGEYLMLNNILFKWFYGHACDELFVSRIEVTIKALQVIKNIASAKVALVGGIAPGFNDFYFDERIIKKRFGTDVFRLHEISEVLDRAKSASKDEVSKVMDGMKSDAVACCVENIELEKAARVYIALERMAHENGYQALAVSCWPKFWDEYNIAVCSVLSYLNQNNIVAACEGDISGAIAMLLLNYLGSGNSMLMDLSGFDEADQTVLMWHCGPAPSSFADDKGMRLCPHPITKIKCPDQTVRHLGVVGEQIFRQQEISILRIVRDFNEMLILTGEFLKTNKDGFVGSRGWLGKIEMLGKEISVRDLINTIMVQRLPHHYPIIAGKHLDDLLEIGAWLGIKPVEQVPYKNYIQNSI
ncbi:MAG: hypothetical protein M1308_13720 [Actinobacteria bacterium]|nr:hypothetical protein [Actinomycetota bacterium]